MADIEAALFLCLMRFLIPALFCLLSCGMLKKKPAEEVQGPKAFFKSKSIPEIHESLMLYYALKSGGVDSDLSIYPKDNHGFAGDYAFEDSEGSFAQSRRERENGTDYFLGTSDSVFADSSLNYWLSNKNYAELQKNGTTRMRLKDLGFLQFNFSKSHKVKIMLEDSLFEMPAIEINAVEKPCMLLFLPDPDYPLIIKMQGGQSLELVQIDNRLPDYMDFKLEKGAVLHYHILLQGSEETNVQLLTDTFYDSYLSFTAKGYFKGAEMNYDIENNLIYSGNAIKNPLFELPVFSPMTVTIKDDSSQWILFSSEAIQNIIKNGHGFLPVPHFAEYPGAPEDYEDSSSWTEARKAWDSSFTTEFTWQHFGRIPYTNFVFFRYDGAEEVTLPTWRFHNEEYHIDIEVLADKQFPILLYYNDGEAEVTMDFARNR